MIPYGRQSIDNDDIAAVEAVLKSDYLTQGPAVEEFEKALAAYCGSTYAVVVSNGTTALHAAYIAMDLKEGDEVITSPLTFPATSNAALWQGACPVFVDIDPRTGNIDAEKIEEKITSKTRAIAPIDYTGRPVDLDHIREIAKKHNLIVVEDACQALGGSYKGKKIGSLSDLTVFSFHPVKSITTGEGGAILTNNENFYKRMKKFITHGITKTDFVNPTHGPWYFEMQMLGNNYRLTDMQAALGLSQLKKLDRFIEKRRALVKRYNEAFQNISAFQIPLLDSEEVQSAWHLYVIELQNEWREKRRELVEYLRDNGVGAQIHHIPVHLHPYYQSLGFKKGELPLAENFYDGILSLPLYPDLTEEQQDMVIELVKNFFKQ